MTGKGNRHGGRRPGAGRPAGRPNKATAEKLRKRGGRAWLDDQLAKMNLFQKLLIEELAKDSACDHQLTDLYSEKFYEAAALAAPHCHSKPKPISWREAEENLQHFRRGQQLLGCNVELPKFSQDELSAMVDQLHQLNMTFESLQSDLKPSKK